MQKLAEICIRRPVFAAMIILALVVVGAMGHGVFSRTSVGAVAMQVITHARCPVLVVGHETAGGSPASGRVVVGDEIGRASCRERV